MSYTKLGYPSAFASEGDPLAGGKFPGDYDPYIHGVGDTMHVDDKTGRFSIDVRSSLASCCSLLTRGSTWRDSRSLRLPLLWSRPGGTMRGDRRSFESRRFTSAYLHSSSVQ